MRHIKVYLIAAATAVTLTAAAGYAQNSGQHDHATPPAAQGAGMNHQAMMASMQAEQKKLDDLVAKMNAAQGSDKVDRIADVVNEMAAMHRRMNGMMMMMQNGTMQMPHDAHHPDAK